MTKKFLIITIFIIGAVISVTVLFISYQRKVPTEPEELTESEELAELKLSDYPEIFKEDTIIVIGKNATLIEKESASLISKSLGELTGNTPIIKEDVSISKSDKLNSNLILIETPYGNDLLEEVYELTDVEKVTPQYPGENKGILQILKNPWNSSKALLIIAGSNEKGVKAGSEALRNAEEISRLKIETLVIASKPPEKSEKKWITGGTKTTAILVSLNREIVNPGEGLIITVKAWTFAPKQVVDYDVYFKLYRTDNPDKALREKKVHVHSEKEEMYARAGPFDWIITAPEKKGTYKYRVVKKTDSEPSFDDFDIMQKVEFEVRVE